MKQQAHPIVVAILFLALFGVPDRLWGQKRNTNWLMTGNWITFASGDPINVEDPPTSASGAALSDTSGALKVYASIEGLKDAQHTLIGNHPAYPPYPFVGGTSQTGVFVPRPGFLDGAFFLGLFEDNSDGAPVRRMGILTLDLGGPGIQPAVLDTGFTWFMTDPMKKCMVVPHANGIDYWFVAQLAASNVFHAYSITGAGITGAPVISSVGPSTPMDWDHGKMIPTLQGNRFANVVERLNYHPLTSTPESLCLHLFDDATGEVEEAVVLPDLHRIKGVEFSPSGRYLYVADFWTPAGLSPRRRDLYQYDLEASDVAGSRVLIHTYTTNSTYGSTANVLTLGPNGKIYMALELFADTLGVIQSPDSLGAQCDFAIDAIQCPWPWITLPAPVKRYHDDALSSQRIADSSKPLMTGVHPNPTRDRVQLSGLPATAYTFMLHDPNGRIARSGTLVQNTIDISAIASGSYVIEVLDASGARLGAARVMKD